MSKTDAVSLFSYWTDGNTEVECDPDPPRPEEARPFHVVIRDDGWIPVSILVFARDEEHAASRVRQALVTCRERQYVSESEHDRSGKVREFTTRWIEAIDARGQRRKKSRMWCEVSPLDTARMVAEVVWASNGGLL